MWKMLLLALLLSSGSQASDPRYTGPICLGSFRIDRPVSVRSLFKQLGQPATKSPPFCFQSQDGRSFLYVDLIHVIPGRVAEVLLSDFPNCIGRARQNTEDDLRAWKTGEGIGLGSSEEEVLEAYGRPSAEEVEDSRNYARAIYGYHPSAKEPPEIGHKSLFYAGILRENEWCSAQFGIRDKKVSWISLSANE